MGTCLITRKAGKKATLSITKSASSNTGSVTAEIDDLILIGWHCGKDDGTISVTGATTLENIVTTGYDQGAGGGYFGKATNTTVSWIFSKVESGGGLGWLCGVISGIDY